MSFSMSEDEWDIVIDVHLKGHFCTTHFAGAYWRQRAKDTGEPADGVIVNTASESGLYGNAGQVNYAAAKAGIAAMTIVPRTSPRWRAGWPAHSRGRSQGRS
jgi:3-oxoacyl-[acyl-carrier protein] reductase